ncbi:MAG: hypothetical protein JRJ78_14170 [Deltaproteobacteria bacterium]|nr:hypothetical protein [Deltaproteobacteria bacterium]
MTVHKHKWLKVGGLFDSEGNQITVKFRCVIPHCLDTKEIRLSDGAVIKKPSKYSHQTGEIKHNQMVVEEYRKKKKRR